MTRNIRQNLSFLVHMINLLELDNFPRCQQPQKSQSEWANSLSALRKTFKAKTLSRSSSSGGLASRTSHTLAKVPNSRTHNDQPNAFIHSHATPLTKAAQIKEKDSNPPVPNVLTSSKSLTDNPLDFPPNSLFLGSCCISSGGNTCVWSLNAATNFFSCSTTSGSTAGVPAGVDRW